MPWFCLWCFPTGTQLCLWGKAFLQFSPFNPCELCVILCNDGYLSCHFVHSSVWLSYDRKCYVWHNMQTFFYSFFFISFFHASQLAMAVDAIDKYHPIHSLMTLVLTEGHKFSRKQKKLACFSHSSWLSSVKCDMGWRQFNLKGLIHLYRKSFVIKVNNCFIDVCDILACVWMFVHRFI